MSQDLPTTLEDRQPLRRKLIRLIICMFLLLAGLWLGDHQDGRPDPLHRLVFTSRFDAWLDWFLYPIERNGFLRPSYIEQTLTDVAMSEDGSRLWVAASNGKIITSDDSGRTWSDLISGTDVDLAAIIMPKDRSCGWVVGAAGVILKTDNGGASWSRQESNTSVDLYTIAMHDDCRHGWIGGRDLMLFTVDGGVHWTRSRLAETDAGGYIAGTVAAKGRIGFVIDQSYGLRTTEDAGASWSPLESVITRDFVDVVFGADGRTGWGIGWRDGFSRSADGGKTWQTIPLPFRAVLPRLAMSADGSRGVIVDRDGRILVSADGGQSWTPAVNPAGGALMAVTLSRDGRRGVAVGPGSAITTEDGGKTWVPRMRGGGRIRSIFIAADAKTIWMAGDGPTLMKSEDRGRTWLPQLAAEEPWLQGTRTLRGFHLAPDGKRGWMAGDRSIFWTWDGGQSWTAVPVSEFDEITDYIGFDDGSAWLTGLPVARIMELRSDTTRHMSEPIVNFSFEALAFSADRKRIWAVGRDRFLARSEDGGVTWQATLLPNPKESRFPWFTAVAMLPDGRGSIGGTHGAMLVTEDGGKTWTPAEADARTTLNDLLLEDDGHGWSVGNHGTLLETTDAGQTWHRKTPPFRVSITAIAMTKDDFGLVGGFARNIATTEDGGKTWHRLDTYGLDRAPWAYGWALICLAAAATIALRRHRD